MTELDRAPTECPLAFGARAVSGRVEVSVDEGWELLRTAPDAARTPAELARFEADSVPAIVPGTAAMVDGSSAVAEVLAGSDHWYRCRLDRVRPQGGRERLVFDGLATLAEVFLDGRLVLESESMFVARALDVTGVIDSGSVLAIRFRALAPVLRARRARGRWPTRLVAEKNLRFVRTSLLGHLEGLGPAVAAVGPYRPVRRVIDRDLVIDALHVRPRLEGRDGYVEVELQGCSLRGPVRAATLVVGGARAELGCESGAEGAFRLRGSARVRDVEPWWPHTHGRPALHAARIELALDDGEARVILEPVGFRRVELAGEEAGDFGLRINGEGIFARGACFLPDDAITPAVSGEALRRTLELARDAGMNMLRVPGIASYPSDAFHRACDELGILVFQDFMFANMDYPADDPAFMAAARAEVDQRLARIGARPSLALLSGGSEVAQQAAMMGIPRSEWASALFDELLPERCARFAPEVPYVPGSPQGGAMPFHPSTGLAQYYGVGAYLRPIDDAGLRRVRFAAECLAFSNVPEDESLDAWLGHARLPAHHPRYKARVPRDPHAGWDFADVTDHYLEALFGVEARRVRYADPERYLALCRATTAEVMARVQRVFRAEGSACRGALVWTLRDIWDGAGFGVLDARGRPKSAYYALRRAWAPLAAFFVDEGLDGLVLHVVNDRPEVFRGEVELALRRVDGRVVERARVATSVPARGQRAIGVEDAIGRFVDSSYAYRFGPPAHAVVSARLFAEGEASAPDDAALAHAHHLPLDLAHTPEAELGIVAEARALPDGAYRLTLRADRLALFVYVEAKGHRPDDAYFHLVPGEPRHLRLEPFPDAPSLRGRVRALNALAASPIHVVDAEPEDGAA